MKTILSALAGATLLAGPALAQDQDLLIGSTSASSSHYGYFVAVGQLINENAEGLSASVVETGATLDNIKRMSRDQVDLGLVTTNTAQHAYAGTDDFEGNQQDLRMLWVYTNAPQNAIVRTDAGVEDLEGLEGVRFNPGIRGSSTEATTEAVFDTLGLSADFARGSTTDIVSAIKDNRVVGYVKSGSGQKLDGSTMDIATATDIEVLGLSDEQAETLRQEMPDLSVVDIPEGAAEGIPAYATWAFGVGVAAPASMDDEAAYEIVSAIMADESAQANAMASIGDADLAQMTLDYGTIPLHPGAARWFEENGYDIPEKLQPED